ncbi:MAG: ABC transporter ATP-binding protein [Pleomorphochaeta sp.]
MPPFSSRGPGAHGKGAKPKSFKKTSLRLLKYLAPYKFKLILVFICIILAATTTIASSVFLRFIIDYGITPLLGVENPDFSYFYKTVPIFAAVLLIGVGAMYYYSKAMVKISQKVLKTLRDQMFEHMQSLPLIYFDTNGHGNIMSRYTSDIDAMVNLLAQSLPQLLLGLLQFIGILIAMLLTSWRLSIVAFTLLAGMLVVVQLLGKASGKYFSKQQQSLGEVNSYIEEMTAGQKEVKVYNQQNEVNKRFDKLNNKLFENSRKASSLANIFMPITTGLSYVQYVILAMVGGLLALSGYSTITLGVIVSFLQLSRNLAQPVSSLGQQLNSLMLAIAGAERIFDLIDEESEGDLGHIELVNTMVDKDDRIVECKEKTCHWAFKDGDKYTLLHGEVELKDVNFSYVKDKQILKNINVKAMAGHNIAFVGSTGAGKTTITNLINRFYDIDSGAIYYDGINIKDIKKADLRRALGFVLQDTSLFSGTIKENIRYGNLDASDEEVIKAAKLANADHFISLLEDGYDTFLDGEDNLLSVGQRQLLAIARCAVANPPVMILDEATSSIDTRTEMIVQEGMNKLMEGRTVFVIAHRLSTIRNSDVIVVLEHGEIIEMGNHNELLKKKGAYYNLYTGLTKLD